MDSGGPIVQEESPLTAPVDLRTQQIVKASPTINSVDIRNAPSTVMMDCRVPISKYCSIVPTSTEIAKKAIDTEGQEPSSDSCEHGATSG